MSKLILYSSEFTHLPEKSFYNNNYYKSIHGFEVFENCDEFNNVYTFYVVDKDENIFIGCSSSGIDGNKEVSIDFMQEYT